MTATKPTGLEGVVAGDTAICSVEQGALIYRGYEIQDLAANATFEEVAYLLICGEKPTPEQTRFFKDELVANRALSPQAIEVLKLCGPLLEQGSAVPMDVVRTVLSVLGNGDPDAQDNSHEAELRKAKRIVAKIPTIIGHMQNIIDGRDIIAPDTGGDANLSHAANLLYMMTGQRPTPEAEKVMDVSLILYAEHDYNASTFTSRVIAGTLSDMHGAMTGAVAALKGPLHGGANEAAMVMLKEIMEHVEAGGTVEDWMHKAFESKRKLMGFGHRVYKNGDHRAPILHALGRKVAEQKGGEYLKLFEIGEKVQHIMETEKHIYPNVDFPCGMTYYTMGIPVPQYTPIFVASRVTGWAAHIMEQHANNRLIRPIASYTGPAVRPWNS
ncbi:MAG TPA: citrate synthase [Phycisphaerales bacterium]|nr:citrate synthase [Phycisphaerales bacterium]